MKNVLATIPEIEDKSDVRRRIIELALPALGSSILHVLVFFVDRMMLGRYGQSAIASMQVAGPVNWAFYSLLTSFIVGAIALVARAQGAGELTDRRKIANVAVIAGFVIGAMAWLLLPVLPQFLQLFRGRNTDLTTIAGAEHYLFSVLLTYPFYFVGLTISQLMAAKGDTRTPFIVGIFTNVVNVALNAALIFGFWKFPELGVRGAGIATGTAWVVEALILAGLAFAGEDALLSRSLSDWTEFGPSFDRLKQIGSISGPTFLERSVYHAGFLTFAGFITSLGTTAMAANQACVSIESISFTSSGAIGLASSAVVGQMLGAKRPEAARLAAFEACKLALWILLSGAVIYIAFGETLLQLFTTNSAVVSLGTTVLIIAALEQPGMAVSDVLSYSLRGAGDTLTPLLITLFSIWGIRVFGCYIAVVHLGLGLPGIWYVTALEWTVRATIFFFVWYSGRWKEIKL